MEKRRGIEKCDRIAFKLAIQKTVLCTLTVCSIQCLDAASSKEIVSLASELKKAKEGIVFKQRKLTCTVIGCVHETSK
jgi:hypothetical protein